MNFLNQILEIIGIVICYIFGLILIKYIVSKIYFINRMRRKYDILKPIKIEKYQNIVSFFAIIITLLYPSSFMILANIYIYSFNKICFFLLLVIYFAFGLYYIKKYKNYDIIEYICWYSSDLFDWDKIYVLKIDEDLKKQCFLIHNIEYEAYKETYLRNLQLKQDILKLQIDKLEETAQMYKKEKDN